MAREHHCPNCGAQACNASTSKIHTCGVCAAIWEEDLSVPSPAPAPPKPAAPTASTPPPTPAPAAAPPKPVPVPPKPAPPASPPPATTATAPPPKPSTPISAAPAAKPAAAPAAGGKKTLAEALAEAKVKRCPKCSSDGLAKPSDFRMAQGRLVLVDSQTYRGHEWYADTGELLTPAATPARPTTAAAPGTSPAS